MQTTIGQILVNEALPEDMRDYHRAPMNKKEVTALFDTLQKRYPDHYKDIAQRIMQAGQSAATSSGTTVSLKDLVPSAASRQLLTSLRSTIRAIAGNPHLDEQIRSHQIVSVLHSVLPVLRERTYQEGLKEKNNFSLHAASGARGNPSNVNSLRGADLLVLDHHDRPVPIPIFHNYSEGLDPAEYWAAAPGARKGVIGERIGTASAGYLGKQIITAAADLLVTDEKPTPGTGLPVDSDDPDNVGAVLARDYGTHLAGTVITPTIQKELRAKFPRILVHSPITAGGHGIPRLAAGHREKGGFSAAGDNVGIAAAQAVSEPLTQSILSTKHGGGVIGADFGTSASGFTAIDQMFTVPSSFQGAATLAEQDGRVDSVEEAPQGGKYILIGKAKHYVPPHFRITAKVGDTVEAGDALTNGVPNPADIVAHKHIGEGRRYFMEALGRTLKEEGIPYHRRNLEIVARALINHVRVVASDGMGDALPDDIVPYDYAVQDYVPRKGSRTMAPTSAVGKYLESPALHYSIGTRITPRVAKTLTEFGVPQLQAHDEEPAFVPLMVRSNMSSSYHPDVFRRLGGFHLQRSFLDALYGGKDTKVHSPSYQHPLAEATGFGKDLTTQGTY